MIRIAVTFALLLALGREAAAQDVSAPQPRLKELVTVTSDLVRIGDLIENAGAAANVAIFRAPDLGHTGAVQIARVTEALKPHDMAPLDTGGLSEVVVTRLSRVITARDIEERIARALSGQHGYGDARNLSVTIDREVRTMHIEASVAADLMIARMSVEPRSGRFDVTFDIPGSAVARRLPMRFAGIVTETVEAATLTRAINRGEVVRASDVAVERRPKAEVAGEAVNADQAIGLSAKRALRSGQVLRHADLIKTDVIQRNEMVSIFYEAPGITLTVRGKALEAGAVGDAIGILNIQSNRTIHAVVSGPGQVTINATPPRLAAAVTPEPDNTRRSAQ